MKEDSKYLYDQIMTLADQRTGKFYLMQIADYAVPGINDWEYATQWNLGTHVKRQTT